MNSCFWLPNFHWLRQRPVLVFSALPRLSQVERPADSRAADRIGTDPANRPFGLFLGGVRLQELQVAEPPVEIAPVIELLVSADVEHAGPRRAPRLNPRGVPWRAGGR